MWLTPVERLWITRQDWKSSGSKKHSSRRKQLRNRRRSVGHSLDLSPTTDLSLCEQKEETEAAAAVEMSRATAEKLEV